MLLELSIGISLEEYLHAPSMAAPPKPSQLWSPCPDAEYDADKKMALLPEKALTNVARNILTGYPVKKIKSKIGAAFLALQFS
jgi:hypothetical protein